MPLINDVTHLNPIEVFAAATPKSTADVQAALRNTRLPISVGGGHFSMGGHTASPGSLHLDLSNMNQVLAFDPQAKSIRVQAGIRWRDIQKFIDPHGLAVKIMQTYANFTVGGTLSVNAHGRYMGLGPVVLSVRSIMLVLASGEALDASPSLHPELFHAALGGYGAIGIITEADLDLVDNCRVERSHIKMATSDYLAWFRSNVRGRPEVIFHNADLYPPHYGKARAVTWTLTDKPPTTSHRLQPPRKRYPLEKYVFWAVTETPLGKLRREFLIDPLLYAFRKVHWRNYEAGYDVAELEPVGRRHRTYVLQEYFVPVQRIMEFVPRMAAILGRHKVNAVNVSIRHALADPGTVMAWARGETFAFVLYYKQRTRDNAKERVAVWTRELIDAVLECGGTYYLPYQLHATPEQFHKAYPRALELFGLKRRLDPEYRLRGALWDKYYCQPTTETRSAAHPQSLFHDIYAEARTADRFYAFLKNIFNLVPEDRLHTLIKSATARHADDEAIYHVIQRGLPAIRPRLAMLTYAFPSLRIQKTEMGEQTRKLIDASVLLQNYIEIGTTGRYVKALAARLPMTGNITLIHEKPQTMSPVDIVERGQIRRIAGKHFPLNDYAPLSSSIPGASIGLVSCFIGLHHMKPEKLPAFLDSIARVLRPGGYFVVREHDVRHGEMANFVALAHTVFNACLGESWETNLAELRHFASVDEWICRIEATGLKHTGRRLLQAGDPSDNVLFAFRKPESAQ